MNGEEVWVRMMAAVLSGGHDVTTDTFAQWADEAVAEWRKRYGKPAEPEAPAFNVGDRVRLPNGTPATVVNLSLDYGVLIERRDLRMTTREWFRPDALTLDPTPQQR